MDKSRRSNTCRNHTATHILHQALREILGEHVRQAGSLVSAERLRFDFNHLNPLTPSQLQAVEQRVNEIIWENVPVTAVVTDREKAGEMGALALFEERYGDAVRVVRVGDYSRELCGGTHVQSTGDIGLFKIVSEGGIGAGVRRIEALTAGAAYRYFAERNAVLEEAASQVKSDPLQLVEKISGLQAEIKELRRENKELKLQMAGREVEELLSRVMAESGVPVLSARVKAANMETLREMADRLKNKLDSGIIILGAESDGKVLLVGAVTADLVSRGFHAGKLVGEIARLTGGGGGGRPDMAQAGGKDPQRLDMALDKVYELVQSRLQNN